MKNYFPSRLLKGIRQAEQTPRCEFVPQWVSVYECMSIQQFNAILRAEVLSLRIRYRYSATCHGDWVSLSSWYRVNSAIGNENKPEWERPLNSWVLKDPVGYVPSCEELETETTWLTKLSVLLKEQFVAKTVAELHSSYVRESCKDMVNYERLLFEWRTAGSPVDQEDFSFSSAESRKVFRAKLKQQRNNMLDAKKKLELYRKTDAPEFLISSAAGASLREARLLEQMYTALSVCY